MKKLLLLLTLLPGCSLNTVGYIEVNPKVEIGNCYIIPANEFGSITVEAVRTTENGFWGDGVYGMAEGEKFFIPSNKVEYFEVDCP